MPAPLSSHPNRSNRFRPARSWLLASLTASLLLSLFALSSPSLLADHDDDVQTVAARDRFDDRRRPPRQPVDEDDEGFDDRDELDRRRGGGGGAPGGDARGDFRRRRRPVGPGDYKDITWEQALWVLDAAIDKSREINRPMNIAIVDAGGNLKCFIRMDNAWIGSIDLAIKKARTARLFDLPTAEIGKRSQPGGPLYGIEESNGGLITFAGGIPLTTEEGVVIGAVGISGSSIDNEEAVARAAAESLRTR